LLIKLRQLLRQALKIRLQQQASHRSSLARSQELPYWAALKNKLQSKLIDVFFGNAQQRLLAIP
jgi:hypothetical protein